ncbi:MAG: hypothetical protein HONBIEJF_02470 [Fimbriimonadaceae bacterium]|nr:hypothetical protein [Fimbriimonadaceae bacterium]
MDRFIATLNLGTKSDVVGGTMEAPALPILPTLAGMVLVYVLLKWLAPILHKKGLKKLNTTLGSSIRIEESATFPGGTLYVVEARGKTLLIGQGATGLSCLADLTEGESQQPAFFELVDAAQKQVATAVVSAPDSNNDLEKLRRLERLLGA